MDENSLVQLAREGSQEAFRNLFDANKQRIYALAFRYSRNREDAEDILQETFIKAFNSLDKFNAHEGHSFSSWLYRISINSSIDLIRKNKKMNWSNKNKNCDPDNLENISSPDQKTNPEYMSHIKDIRKTIHTALNHLTARQRMIFILRHYQQLSTQEIAEYMNCSQGSVKKQLFRAIARIKVHFKNFLPENNYEMQKV